MSQRRKDDNARFLPGSFANDLDERLHLLQKFRRAPLKRTRHSVPEKNRRRFHQLDLFLQLLPAFIRWLAPRLQKRKPRARNAAWRVARPTDIAKDNIPLRPSCGEPQLEVIKFLHPLNERVAEESHTVAILDLEWGKRRGVGVK